MSILLIGVMVIYNSFSLIRDKINFFIYITNLKVIFLIFKKIAHLEIVLTSHAQRWH